MRWKTNHRAVAAAGVMLALAGAGGAQTDFATGSIIKGFDLPQRDKEGNLKLRIHGEQATVMSASRIRVEGLKIDLFNAGAPQGAITSPRSDYWREEQRLTSESGVLITYPALTLSAKTMDWELNESRGIFTGDVKVLLIKKEVATP